MQKKNVFDVSNKSQPQKRWKEVVEKDMLARSLRRTDAQVWRLDCKNLLTPACRENKPDCFPRRIELFESTILELIDDDDFY